MSSPENSGAPGADAYASDTLDHHGLVAGLVDPIRAVVFGMNQHHEALLDLLGSRDVERSANSTSRGAE
jgi:hypothetical protein